MDGFVARALGLCILGLVCGGLELHGKHLIDGDFEWICGRHSLQVVLLTPQATNVSSLLLYVKDKNGMLHHLQNDSACGTWVSLQLDGSLVLGAEYTGCFVSEKEGMYTLTLGMEASLEGQPKKERQLRCPVLPAMDVPGVDVCDAIYRGDWLLCGSLPITQDICQAEGCCYDPSDSSDSSTPCSFGIPVTAHCTQTGEKIIAVWKYARVPSMDLGSLQLLNMESACSGLRENRNDVFLVYQLPLTCWTMYQDGLATVNGNKLEATNSVIPSSEGSSTGESPFRLTVRCSFTASGSFVPLTVDVYRLPPPLPVNSSGRVLLEMRIATDETYGSYYTSRQYPVVKSLRESVFLEVRVLQKTDPSLVLVLNECWATPSSNPMQQPQWPALVKKCPFSGGVYKTILIPVGAAASLLQFPSHYQRFAVRTFTFVDNRQHNVKGQIYFHCAASLCFPSLTGACSTFCPTSKKKRRVTEALDVDMRLMTLVTAEGPVYFKSDEDRDSHSAARTMIPALRRSTVVAMGLLCIVACFVLWKYQKDLQPKEFPGNM